MPSVCGGRLAKNWHIGGLRLGGSLVAARRREFLQLATEAMAARRAPTRPG